MKYYDWGVFLHIFAAINEWRPGDFQLEFRQLKTSARPHFVELTCGSLALVKSIAGDYGPYSNIQEWAGVIVADELGLSVFEQCIATLRGFEEPVLVIKWVKNLEQWGAQAEQFETVVNRADLEGLILCDTWILNGDRHQPGKNPNYGNYMLAPAWENPESADDLVFEFMAADFGFAYAGCLERPIKLLGIDYIKCESIFGMAPQLEPIINHGVIPEWIEKLGQVDLDKVGQRIFEGTKAWKYPSTSIDQVLKFLKERRDFLTDNFGRLVTARTQPQPKLEEMSG